MPSSPTVEAFRELVQSRLEAIRTLMEARRLERRQRKGADCSQLVPGEEECSELSRGVLHLPEKPLFRLFLPLLRHKSGHRQRTARPMITGQR